MTIRTLRLLSLAVLLSLALVAGAAEGDNPAYTQWAKFKLGATARYKSLMEIMGNKTESEVVHTLVDLTPEKAVVETATVMTVNGVRIDSPKVRVEYSARIPGEPAVAAPAPAAAAKTETSKAEVTVAGRSFACDVYKTTMKQAGADVAAETWTSGDVPGGLVKSVTKMTGQLNSVTTLELTGFEPGK